MPAKGWMKLTPEQVQEITDRYFADCDAAVKHVMIGKRAAEVSRPYTDAGLAYALGITRDTLYRWTKGEAETEWDTDAQKRVSDTLTRAKQRIDASTVERSLTGELDSKIAALILSSMGYSTKQEIAHSGAVEVKLTGATDAQAKAWSK